MHSNLDLDNIMTPVDVDKFEDLLIKANYDQEETKYLVNGFRNGFALEYKGDRDITKTAPNLKIRIGSPLELWNKVMVEVGKQRYAGPFVEPPFKRYIQSPIGLVPKDKGTKTRLIFHLSYPRSGKSVNSEIPHEYCTVKYPAFDEAIKLCLQEGKGCSIGKSDMSSAFRHVPMRKEDWVLLVMKARNPLDGKEYFFVDKCLPFGSSISCAIFQRFSNAVAYLMRHRTGKSLVNYLDDYFFAALIAMICDQQLNKFLDVCSEINFPVALEKTFWHSTLLTFLGLLLDTEKQLVCVPLEKLEKASNQIDRLLSKKKAKVLDIQKVCGLLNFLCRCVVPGRVFLRRLYASTNNHNLKPHHHIKLTEEHKLDLVIWKQFLEHPQIVARPFMDFNTAVLTLVDIDMYSDASRNFKLGFGAYCGTEWTYGQWDARFMEICQPSIEYLELFGVAVAILNWIKLFKNKRIILHCDNEAVVHMINNTSAKCKHCMILLRLIVLETMVHNVKVTAHHVGTKANGKADALSRLDMKRFRSLDDRMNRLPTQIPEELWPIKKIWGTFN